jgi:hypothetical protein
VGFWWAGAINRFVTEALVSSGLADAPVEAHPTNEAAPDVDAATTPPLSSSGG